MKTHYYSALIFMLFSASSLYVKAVSMGEILGQVIEKETMKPVAFAEVVFESNSGKVKICANEYGYYHAPHLPIGKYQIRVAYNNRTFVMNKIRVYDSFSSEINFVVSNRNDLPESVELNGNEPATKRTGHNDIQLANSTLNPPDRSLGESLAPERGINAKGGTFYTEAGNDARFFVDGSHVMARPSFGSGEW